MPNPPRALVATRVLQDGHSGADDGRATSYVGSLDTEDSAKGVGAYATREGAAQWPTKDAPC